MAAETTVSVSTSSAAYDVRIGSGMLARGATLIREVTPARTVALLSDEIVWGLYGGDFAGSLTSAGFRVVEIVIPPGETSKSWEQAGVVLDRMADAGLERGDALVALGGGVIGDLGGFCAAVYLRGIDYIQVPTTLLAQVDSSVGGKTGVDLAAGKNLAGAFKQPLAVLADTSVLATLSETEWASGLAEVAKTAMLDSAERVAWVTEHAGALLARDEDRVAEMVRDAAAHKAAVVSADEHESGERESLNYGHTLGHAIERVAGYGVVPHGVAVAEGMRFAAQLAKDVLRAPDPTAEAQERMLAALGIGRPEYPRDAAALIEAMHADKKARSGTVRFVFVPRPGHHVVTPVDDETIARTLRSWIAVDSEGQG